MRIRLTPTRKQFEAWKHLSAFYRPSRYILLGGGAGGGKSWLICEWLVYMCYTFPDTKWFIARNELKRLMASTYVTFQKVCKLHNIPDSDWKLNGQYNYIQFKNGSRIDLLDGKMVPRDLLYERFGSTEYTGGAIEEGGEVEEGLFEVLKTRIGRHMNKEYGIIPKILLTCNPKQNWLKERFYDPWRDKNLEEGFVFIQSLAKDNNHNDPIYIENLEKIKDKVMRERLLYGNWDYEIDPYCIYDIDAIHELTKNKYVETNQIENDLGNNYITVDPSGEGKDSSIVIVWTGFVIEKIYNFASTQLPELQSFLEDLAVEWQIGKENVIVEQDGLGVGLVQYGGFCGVRVGSGAIGENNDIYMNLRAELFWASAKKINDGGLYIKKTAFTSENIKRDLEKDLKAIKKANVDSDEKKLSIISRKDIKKEIGRSPDYIMALIPRFYVDLRPYDGVDYDEHDHFMV
jgi:hypothetical protein